MNVSRPRNTIWILLLTLAAAVLQFLALDAQSLWYDEGFSAWISRLPPDEIVALTAADVQPPLYYLLLHRWIALAGDTEYALRFLSAAFAILAVPLLWQLARHLRLHQQAASAAALLVAVSPLWLWYGREVRMYSLALALLLSAGLPLLALFEFRSGITRRWQHAAAFAALMTAALYTHYYVWFVFGAWALVALVPGWRSRSRAFRLPLATAFVLPVLAFVPWVSVAAQRLTTDVSYWDGILSLRQVVESTLGSWMTGHTVQEALSIPLGWGGGVLALVGAVLLARRAGSPTVRGGLVERGLEAMSPRFYHWLLLVLWLILPFLALIAISWSRPKFHARYLIFAAPAFLLLLGALLGELWLRRWAGRVLSITLLACLVAVSLLANWNLFQNPAYAKTDWRGAVAYLEQHRQPDEPIVVVSGHARPVFDYYFGVQENVVYLPPSPTLDTTAVLNVFAATELAHRLQGAGVVWLLNWQDEVVDPEGVVPALLRLAGGTGVVVPQFMGLRLTRWELPPSAPLGAAIQPEHALDSNFGGDLKLLGWKTPPAPAPVDEGFAISLYWTAQRTLEADYKVRVRVVDAAGVEYGAVDQRPTSYYLPTPRWEPGVPRLASLVIPLEPGTPPGEYWVRVSVYDEATQVARDVLDHAGAPQGQDVRLGPVVVAPSASGWLGAGPPSSALLLEQRMLDDQHLLAARLTLPAQLEPGQRLPLTLWWRTGGPLPGAQLHVAWEQNGSLIYGEPHGLAGEGWPGSEWRRGDLLMTPLTIRVPRAVEPGDTRLLISLGDGAGRESAQIPIASAEVMRSSRVLFPPVVVHEQAANFAGKIGLLGYDLSVDRVSSAAPITLTLHWETLSEIDESLTFFAHLLDAHGMIIPGAGQDKLPLEGLRPTDSWTAGEFISDTVIIMVGADIQPGPYTIEVGWYDAADPALPRLPVEGIGADRDRVLLQSQLYRDGE
jgi:mannosyltransferase